MTTIGFALRMAAREIRAAPRRLLPLTGSVAIGRCRPRRDRFVH